MGRFFVLYHVRPSIRRSTRTKYHASFYLIYITLDINSYCLLTLDWETSHSIPYPFSSDAFHWLIHLIHVSSSANTKKKKNKKRWINNMIRGCWERLKTIIGWKFSVWMELKCQGRVNRVWLSLFFLPCSFPSLSHVSFVKTFLSLFACKLCNFSGAWKLLLSPFL